MGRWFRRKDKDRKKSRAESEAALEESRAAAGEVLEQEPVEEEPRRAAGFSRGDARELPEEAPEERRGFFARFRKSRPAERSRRCRGSELVPDP